jgi:hypothetical protein
MKRCFRLAREPWLPVGQANRGPGALRPQDPIVLVLSPPWRTVLVLVIERFACMASMRLPLRPTTAVPQLADHAPYLRYPIHY